jgi:nicotinate phosphoribosyltransferase
MTYTNKGTMKVKGLTEAQVWREGDIRLTRKHELLCDYPEIRWLEFGTRRPFSPQWQQHVLERQMDEVPTQLVGTSNVYLGKLLGLNVRGTHPHEILMVMAGILGITDEKLRGSVMFFIDQWKQLYGLKLTSFLTDTYGTPAFFEDLGAERAAWITTYRVDSMDPFKFGDEYMIPFLQSVGIDPKTKFLQPSDGLWPEKMIEIYLHFRGRVGLAPDGWGGNCSNDMGLPVPNLVAKAVRANGIPLVKLSDVVGKNLGPTEFVNWYNRVFACKC